MITSIIPIVFGGFIIYVLFRFKGATKGPADRIELTQRFKSFDLKMLIGFFILVPLNTLILTYLLTQLSNFGFTNIPETKFIIRPNAGTWLVISIFLSMATSLVLIILIVKKLKPDEEGHYWKYYNLKYGFNATWLLKYLSITIVLFVTTLTISQLNSYVKFTTDSISINKPFELTERTYPLEDISEITYYLKTVAPNGNVVDKPHYSIEFSDGFQWRTNDDLRTPNVKDFEIINWLINTTERELIEIEIGKN